MWYRVYHPFINKSIKLIIKLYAYNCYSKCIVLILWHTIHCVLHKVNSASQGASSPQKSHMAPHGAVHNYRAAFVLMRGWKHRVIIKLLSKISPVSDENNLKSIIYRDWKIICCCLAAMQTNQWPDMFCCVWRVLRVLQQSRHENREESITVARWLNNSKSSNSLLSSCF